jgi:hypothetical protein
VVSLLEELIASGRLYGDAPSSSSSSSPADRLEREAHSTPAGSTMSVEEARVSRELGELVELVRLAIGDAPEW